MRVEIAVDVGTVIKAAAPAGFAERDRSIMTFDPEEYYREFAEVLRTSDKDTILEFYKKHNIPTASSDLVFWASVHKARLYVPGLTDEERVISRDWLLKNGFTALIG